MKLKHTALWSGVVAAALLLTACGKSNSGSGSMSSSGMSSSTASTESKCWPTLRRRWQSNPAVLVQIHRHKGGMTLSNRQTAKKRVCLLQNGGKRVIL